MNRSQQECLTRDVRDGVIAKLAEAVHDCYVFPEIAASISSSIQERHARGEYSEAPDGESFAALLTKHLQEFNQDKHLRVEWEAQVAADPSDESADLSDLQERTRLGNNCIRKVERLPGNVGFMNLTGFVPPDWGTETLVAAMAFLANTSAIIIDLRDCRGGHVRMVPILCSYFFDEPTHLSDFYWRPDDETTQSWTLPYVPGRRLPDIPLLLLTSKDTFSAGEDFAYTLQALGRAKIVGETTRGGAHPGQMHNLAPHFSVFIPSGRPTNPITGTNWEGTGVIPDVPASQEEAMDTAYALALRDVIAGISADAPGSHLRVRDEAHEALANLTSR
ncbi:S41 family peptidase [Candidatus Bipolaricaulota bacterium]|nr:S41 family peptidase [Candidatus Bipolaricaulota bacterium]